MQDLPNNGDYMPPTFWYVMTILFATAFVSLLIWIINRFLVRLEVSIDWLKENVVQLREQDKKQQELIERHDREIKTLLKTRRR